MENAMTSIDEMLGVATFAAAALFVAVALEPVARGTPVVSEALQSFATPIVHLPPVEVVGQRSVEVARIQREVPHS
jgi:hypothetical protein